jgi:hypothetical protein
MTTPQPLLARVRETLRILRNNAWGVEYKDIDDLLAELDAIASKEVLDELAKDAQELGMGYGADKPEGSAQAVAWLVHDWDDKRHLFLDFNEAKQYSWDHSGRVEALYAAPQPPQVPQADEAVPAWAWKQAFYQWWTYERVHRPNWEFVTHHQWIERRARELAKVA